MDIQDVDHCPTTPTAKRNNIDKTLNFLRLDGVLLHHEAVRGRKEREREGGGGGGGGREREREREEVKSATNCDWEIKNPCCCVFIIQHQPQCLHASKSLIYIA